MIMFKYFNKKLQVFCKFLNYWPIIFLIILGIILIVKIEFFFGLFNIGLDLKVNEKINLCILWFTALMIFWYSYETLRLRKESQKQNTTSIRPYLSLLWRGEKREMVIRNIGKGVAVDVDVKLLEYPRDLVGFDKGFVFLKIPALTPGGSTTEFLDNHRHFWPVMGSEEESFYSLVFSFSDIEGNPYYAIFKANIGYNDKFEIIEQKAGRYEKTT